MDPTAEAPLSSAYTHQRFEAKHIPQQPLDPRARLSRSRKRSLISPGSQISRRRSIHTTPTNQTHSAPPQCRKSGVEQRGSVIGRSGSLAKRAAVGPLRPTATTREEDTLAVPVVPRQRTARPRRPYDAGSNSTTSKENGGRMRRNNVGRSRTKRLRRGLGRRTSCSAPGEGRQVRVRNRCWGITTSTFNWLG